MKTTSSSNPLFNGWHRRGYLPHFDQPHVLQFVTFRLADSPPREMLADLARPASRQESEQRGRSIEMMLDRGYGGCLLRDPRCASIVQQALLFFDEQRYALWAWVVMPNHLHLVLEIQEQHPLSTIMHSIKGFTARRINELLGRSCPLWQPDYFDPLIRDELHLANVIAYIENNPVSAGLAEFPGAWPYSSASAKAAG